MIGLDYPAITFECKCCYIISSPCFETSTNRAHRIKNRHTYYLTISFPQKKRLSKPKQQIEMGTQNKTDVDYDWLPKETLEGMSKFAFTDLLHDKTQATLK